MAPLSASEEGPLGAGGQNSEPAEQWAALPASRLEEVLVSEELLGEAKRAFRRSEWVYLYQLLTVALPQSLTSHGSRRAICDGDVHVDGSQAEHDAAVAPPPGARVTVRVGGVDPVPQNLPRRLQKYNAQSPRPEAHLHVLFHDSAAGWAVVNKPVGMHSNPNPCSFGKDALTFQDYLPALLPPPSMGVHCRCPKVCHRLDFRVRGPMVVATSLEAERHLAKAFEDRRVHKEYRAIVCGKVGEAGDAFTVSAPVDGLDAETRVEVLQTVRCPFFDFLSELRLWPVTGRRQQLRKHCALELGAPIVNEEPALFEAAAPAWERRHGCTLPARKKRGPGRLFLEAVEVSVPRPPMPGQEEEAGEGDSGSIISVRTEVSPHFEELLRKSALNWAWEQEHAAP